MTKLTFATGNEQKFRTAKLACEQYGIQLVQDASLDIIEIQSENGEDIARHKAREAFQLLQKPLVITDDTWSIPALGGFPGPYMKSVSRWFSTDDWLRLTRDLIDRRIIINQILVYQDAHEQVIFPLPIEGLLLKTPRGTSARDSNQPIVSFDGGSHSVAEIFAAGESALAGHHNAWDELGTWLQTKNR